MAAKRAAIPKLMSAHTARIIAPQFMGYVYQLLAGMGWTSIHWLHRIRQPTLVMAGSDDPLVPPVNARIISMLIPNNRLFIVAGGGHLFMLHSIDKVVPVIRTFLDSEAPLTALSSRLLTPIAAVSMMRRNIAATQHRRPHEFPGKNARNHRRPARPRRRARECRRHHRAHPRPGRRQAGRRPQGSFATLTVAGRELNKVARRHAARFVKENSAIAVDAGKDVSALARTTYATLDPASRRRPKARKAPAARKRAATKAA